VTSLPPQTLSFESMRALSLNLFGIRLGGKLYGRLPVKRICRDVTIVGCFGELIEMGVIAWVNAYVGFGRSTPKALGGGSATPFDLEVVSTTPYNRSGVAPPHGAQIFLGLAPWG
jgi:hypothetical protein